MPKKVQRTPAQVKRDRAEYKRLALGGMKHNDIYSTLNAAHQLSERGYRLSHAILREDRDAILKEMKDETLRIYDAYVQKKLKEIAKEERESWEKWEESKSGGRPGNPRHLQRVMSCVRKRSKLLGLYPSKKR